MATQLLKLRHVPEDEKAELFALLEEHEIDFYETSAGNWGISMPALWLSNDAQLSEAKTLLKEYGEHRYSRMRSEYEQLKSEGKARTFLDIARENPLQFVVYLSIVAALVYFSIVPFIAISSR
jgi:hypothetical protein